MSKKEKKQGDYQKPTISSAAKRWLIAISIIVLIVIIVVVIVLCIPPNTQDAVNALSQGSQTCYIADSNKEKEEFNTFKNKMASLPYTQEANDILTLSGSIDDIIEFYNDYIMFASSDGNFRDNTNAIKTGFEKAKQAKDKINGIISAANGLESNNGTYIQSAWIDFRKEYANLLEGYSQAISALENVFTGSLGNISKNNVASKNILKAASNYVSVISGDFRALANTEKKGDQTTKYGEQNTQNKIKYLKDFVNKYIVDDSKMNDYYFSDSVLADFDKIDKFYTVTGERNFESVIKSVNASGAFEKQFDAEDSDGVYALVQSFLKGGM